MDLNQAMAALEAAGSEQTRKTYARHGAKGPMFGVSFATQNKLQKQIKRDHKLAQELWQTGNHDARTLATKIADPQQAGDALLERWVRDLTSYGEADLLSSFVAQTPQAAEKAAAWRGDESEWVARTGWLVTANLTRDKQRDDADFLPLLDEIERTIHSRKNYVRDAMNSTLIAIGIRSPALTEAALAVAERIGKVEVDHGQTSCVTPAAGPYILKTLARKQARAKA